MEHKIEWNIPDEERSYLRALARTQAEYAALPEREIAQLARSAARLGRSPAALDRSAQDLLVSYHWPGNVRELENIITRISVLGTSAAVTADELRRWLVDGKRADRAFESDDGAHTLPVGLSLEEMERRLIEATLEQFGGHREKAAKALGIGVRTLSGKLRQYGYAPRAKMFSKAG